MIAVFFVKKVPGIEESSFALNLFLGFFVANLQERRAGTLKQSKERMVQNMYDIKQMRAEKARQIKRRNRVSLAVTYIKSCGKKLLVMKAGASIWLLILNPIIGRMTSLDMDVKQEFTLITILALAVLLIKPKDMRG